MKIELANDMAQPGMRVEVLLHRGEADVWYAGVVIEPGRVQLDDYPYGPAIAEKADITDWRPATLTQTVTQNGSAPEGAA